MLLIIPIIIIINNIMATITINYIYKKYMPNYEILKLPSIKPEI